MGLIYNPKIFSKHQIKVNKTCYYRCLGCLELSLTIQQFNSNSILSNACIIICLLYSSLSI